jgi:hypothetical protein
LKILLPSSLSKARSGRGTNETHHVKTGQRVPQSMGGLTSSAAALTRFEIESRLSRRPIPPIEQCRRGRSPVRVSSSRRHRGPDLVGPHQPVCGASADAEGPVARHYAKSCDPVGSDHQEHRTDCLARVCRLAVDQNVR